MVENRGKGMDTMGSKSRRLFAVMVVAAAATGGGISISSSTTSASGPKTYTATGPPAALGSLSQSASITFANTSRNKINFNSINIAIPSGVTVAAPTLNPLTPGATAQVNATTSTIELRNLNTAPTAAVTVSFIATLPSFCQSYVFASDVRQSNDFNGSLNTFALEGTFAKFTAPCNQATVTCTATDGKPCATGTITDGSGTASVTVNDADGISATLTASIAAGTYTCARSGYTPTSSALTFNIAITNGVGLTSVTKTVTITKPVGTGSSDASTYQACYQAPYDFPALVPSELTQDFARSNFSLNTDVDLTDPSHPLYTGLLLPCGAGYWIDGTPPTTVHSPAIDRAPCLVGVVVSPTTVTTTIQVPAGDPGLRV